MKKIVCMCIFTVSFVVLQGSTLFFDTERTKNVFATKTEQEIGYDENSDVIDTEAIKGIEGHLEVSASIENPYKSAEEKEAILKELAKNFGVRDDYMINTEKEAFSNRVILTKYFEKAVLSISITDIIDTESGEEMMQSLFLELKLEDNLDKILDYREKICDGVTKLNLVPVSNISFFKNFSGTLQTKQKDAITETLLRYMRARAVDEEKDEETYIVYGYSPMESVVYTDEKLNMNIVFEYDKEQDKTYFHLAMPYMKCDYEQ